MSNIFLITSAIQNDYGVYSYQKRLSQLLDTIQSIKTYAPNSVICVCDASEQLLPEEDINKLTNEANLVWSVSSHPYVQHMVGQGLQDTNRMAKKTIGEMVCMMTFLNWLRNQEIRFDRVFKISGRFRLNENFKAVDYSLHKDKIVLKQRKSWYGEDVFYSRLWSFDHSLLESVWNAFEEIHSETMKEAAETDTFRVLEYSMFKFFTKHALPISEVPVIGLEGNFGQDGAPINE